MGNIIPLVNCQAGIFLYDSLVYLILAALLDRVQLLKAKCKFPLEKQEKKKSMLDLKAGLEIIERAAINGAETVRRIQGFSRRRDEDV